MDGWGRGRSWTWGGALSALMLFGSAASAGGLPEVSTPAPDTTPSADHVRSATEPPRFDPNSPQAVQARKEEAARPKPPPPKPAPAEAAPAAPQRAAAARSGDDNWVDPFAPAPEAPQKASNRARNPQPDTAASAMPPQTAAPAAAEPDSAPATRPPSETAADEAVRPSDSAMPAGPPAAATERPADPFAPPDQAQRASAPPPRVIGVDSMGNSSEPSAAPAADSNSGSMTAPAIPVPRTGDPDGPMAPSF